MHSRSYLFKAKLFTHAQVFYSLLVWQMRNSWMVTYGYETLVKRKACLKRILWVWSAWVQPSWETQTCWQTGSQHCCQRILLRKSLGGKTVWEQVLPSWETRSCWQTESLQSCQRSLLLRKPLWGKSVWEQVQPFWETHSYWQTQSQQTCQRSLHLRKPFWVQMVWVRSSYTLLTYWQTQSQQTCQRNLLQRTPFWEQTAWEQPSCTLLTCWRTQSQQSCQRIPLMRLQNSLGSCTIMLHISASKGAEPHMPVHTLSRWQLGYSQ